MLLVNDDPTSNFLHKKLLRLGVTASIRVALHGQEPLNPRDQQRAQELPIADYLDKPLTQQVARALAQHFAG